MMFYWLFTLTVALLISSQVTLTFIHSPSLKFNLLIISNTFRFMTSILLGTNILPDWLTTVINFPFYLFKLIMIRTNDDKFFWIEINKFCNTRAWQIIHWYIFYNQYSIFPQILANIFKITNIDIFITNIFLFHVVDWQ